MKLLKLVLKIIVVAVVSVAVAVLVAPWFIDPNDYKEEIAAEVKRRTGRDLEITGDIRLSFLPWLGLKLEGGRLSNAPGFGSEPFVAVDFAQIRVKPIPLLEKRVELDTIRLQGMVVNLMRNKEGESNWDDLSEPGGRTAERSSGPREHRSGPEGALAVLTVSGLDIEGARIVWDDRASGERISFRDVAVVSGMLQPGIPAEVEASAKVESQSPAVSGRLRLKGTFELDPALTRLAIRQVAATASEVAMGEHQGEVKLHGTLLADLGARRVTISDLDLQARLQSGGLPEKGIDLAMTAMLGVDLMQQTLALESLRLESGDLRIAGTLLGAGIGADPVFSGRLELAKTDIRQWLHTQGFPVPETADPEALRSVAAVLTMRATPDELKVDPLQVSVDGSRIQGEVRVVGLSEHPYTRFDLRMDTFDADRYWPRTREAVATADSGETRAPSAASGAVVVPVLPSELARSLNADGKLRINQLKIGGLRMQDVMLDLNSKDGASDLNVEAARFYQGRLRGWSGVDATGPAPWISVEHHIERARLGPLLRDLTGRDHVTGAAWIEAKLRGRGESAEQLKKTLAGTVEIRVRNGSVKGIDLARTLREAKAIYKGKPLPPSSAPRQTDFSEIAATARIQDGVIGNRDLLAKSSWLRVTGAGEIDLVRESLDYTLTPVILHVDKVPGGEELKDLEGVPVPVELSGAWDHPDFQIDWQTALSAVQSPRLEERIDDKVDSYLEGRVDNSLKDQVKEALKGWFR